MGDGSGQITDIGAVALGIIGVGLFGAAAATAQGSANALTRMQREERLMELFPKNALDWLAYSTRSYSGESSRFAVPFPSIELASAWLKHWEEDDHHKNPGHLGRVTRKHKVLGEGFPVGQHWLRPDGNLSRDYKFKRVIGGRMKITFKGETVPLELFPDNVRDRITTIQIGDTAAARVGGVLADSSSATRVAGLKALAERAIALESTGAAKAAFDELSWYNEGYRPDWPRRSY
jgi:hypothetical protein